MGILKIMLVALFLQGAAAPTQQPPPRPGSIEGFVNGASGEVLPKVTLTLIGSTSIVSPDGTLRPAALPEITATSGIDGKFTFDNVRPGSYVLQAARTGYVTSMYGQLGPNSRATPIAIAAGQRANDIRISLTPDGVITGRVLDSNGQPVSRAIVQAMKYYYSEGGRILNGVQSATTNDMGEYRLFWLTPGSYYVMASEVPAGDPQDIPGAPRGAFAGIPANDMALTLLRMSMAGGKISGSPVNSRTLSDGSIQQEAAVPVYYPGATTVQDAALVNVRGGATTGGINITVAQARVQTIRGFTVDGSTGRRGPMALQLLSKSNSESYGLDSHRSSDDGTFEIAGVVPGSYWIVAYENDVRAVTSVEIGKTDVNNVAVVATSGFSLSGRISSDGITPGGRIPPIATSVRLMSSTRGAPSVSAPVENGTFTLHGLYSGTYQVAVEGSQNIYMKSAHFGNQDGLLDGIRIQVQPDTPLDIVISVATAKLEGRVLNEKREAVSNATVVIVPDPPLRQRTSLYFTPKPDASGKFKIDAPPGRYKAFAWQDVESNAWFDSDFMRNYESKGLPVTIGDGANESIDVFMIPYIP